MRRLRLLSLVIGVISVAAVARGGSAPERDKHDRNDPAFKKLKSRIGQIADMFNPLGANLELPGG